jgi:hypothetical protein
MGRVGDWRTDPTSPPCSTPLGGAALQEAAVAAERVEVVRETGQPTIVPGGVRAANSTCRGVDVTLSDRRLRGAVISCTGPSADVRRSRDPLVQRLLDSRVGHPGPLFLGVDTDDRGCMRDANDALWVVGPLRRANVASPPPFPISGCRQPTFHGHCRGTTPRGCVMRAMPDDT